MGNSSAEQAAEIILRNGNHKAVLITRGKRGMTLLESGKSSAIHIPTIAKEVFDVSGAGDTVLSVLALGISLRNLLRRSLHFGKLRRRNRGWKTWDVRCYQKGAHFLPPQSRSTLKFLLLKILI